MHTGYLESRCVFSFFFFLLQKTVERETKTGSKKKEVRVDPDRRATPNRQPLHFK